MNLRIDAICRFSAMNSKADALTATEERCDAPMAACITGHSSIAPSRAAHAGQPTPPCLDRRTVDMASPNSFWAQPPENRESHSGGRAYSPGATVEQGQNGRVVGPALVDEAPFD